MPVIKGLFFDLDGTLADTFEALYASYAQAFAAEGHEFVTKVEAARLFPRRFDSWATEVVPGIDPAKAKRVADHKANAYADVMGLVRSNEHLVNFIKLQRLHHQMVLVTTARRVSAERVVEAVGLKGMFHHSVFGDEVTHSKPHPEAYLVALQKTGFSPSEVIAFEDSAAGLQAATAAGISVIKVEIPRED
ncbi:MAG TPA: HAD family phosphatase [Candidatus Saccharimonadia bacterium]